MRRNILTSTLTATVILATTIFAQNYEVKEGWNLLGATENITSLNNFAENGSLIWTYDDGVWSELDLSSNSTIDKGDGFWFRADGAGVLNIEDVNNDTSIGVNRVLYAPMSETTTYLIDGNKNVIHTWKSKYKPGLSVYLQTDGSIIRTGFKANSTFGQIGGAGGIIEKINWDGSVDWEYIVSDTEYLQHHDLEILPNGNILLSVWERISEKDALNAGREATNIDSSKGVWADEIREFNPTTKEVVWKWRVWEHITTDSTDSSKININYVGNGPEAKYDWNHINAIDYNAELDQILISAKNFNEVWIIEHNLTTDKASTNAGDLLYRFGNPITYGANANQILYGQHDTEWIDKDTIMLFNNGMQKGSRNYSTVDVFDLPINNGNYVMGEVPTNVWSYSSDELFSSSISGVSYLGDNNYLITEGEDGRIFMVNEVKEKLWEFEVGGKVFKAEHYKSDYLNIDK